MLLNIDKFLSTKLNTDPFEYLIVEDFINTKLLNNLINNFPQINQRGSFPIQALEINPIFSTLITELKGTELRAATEKKFNVSLDNKPVMITGRGYTTMQDGKIHIDSEGKIITFLIYMNEEWNIKDGGNLRILYSKNNIDKYAAEILPKAGTLVAFKCTDNAWHGHKQFEGVRKSLQMNYVKSNSYLIKEQVRHNISAVFKKIKANINQ